MTIVGLIAERVAPLIKASQSLEKLNQFITQLHQAWIAVGRILQEELVQEHSPNRSVTPWLPPDLPPPLPRQATIFPWLGYK